MISMPTHGSINRSLFRFTHLWFPLLVLAAALSATLYIRYMVEREIMERGEVHFRHESEEITRRIIRRMHDDEQVLLGGNSLFSAMEDGVGREEWFRYVTALKFDHYYPGILGIGFSIWLTPEQKESNIRALRAEGFPDYTIRPEGDRPAYTSIIWLEPLTWRNRRAIGYDMYTEPVRRGAMERARDTGQTSIAARVILVQETDKDKQSGMLMYVPSYRRGLPVDTVEQRRAALRGFVYSPIRMNDFVYAAFSRRLPSNLDFEIHAGKNPSADTLMFSSRVTEKRLPPTGYRPAFSSVRTIDAYGVTWRFTFSTLPAFDKEFDRERASNVLVTGIIVSILLGILAFLQADSRYRALIVKEELLQSRRLLQNVIDHSHYLVYAKDVDGRFLLASQSLVEFFGERTHEALLGKTSHDFLPVATADRHRANDLAVMARRELLSVEETVDAPHGPLTFLTVKFPLFNAEGEAYAVCGLSVDITERKQAEVEREQLIRQLRDKAEEMERFIYTVSHDLKSPLITIAGFVGLLKHDFAARDETGFTAHTERITRAAERMNQLLEELLELSRIGRKTHPPEQVSLGELAREAVEMIAGRINEAGALVEVAPDLPEVTVDRRRLLQVYENLIDNAVKFSSGLARTPRILVGVRRESGETLFFVKDNGIGIEPRFVEKVFDLFEKLDPHGSGAGVGLAIVKRIIELHGGKIWAESEGTDKGATFLFTLP